MKKQLLLGSIYIKQANVPCCSVLEDNDDITFVNGIYFQDSDTVDVSGTGTADDPIILTGSATAATFWALGGNTIGAVGILGTIDNFGLDFRTNNTSKMTISTTGTVAINTTANGAVLNVGAAGISSLIADFIGSVNNNGVNEVAIESPNTGNSSAAGLRFYNSVGLVGQIFTGSAAHTLVPNGMLIHQVLAGVLRIAGQTATSFIELATGGTAAANVKVRLLNTGSMAIGSNPTPNASSILDLQSTTLGFLPPRMTTTQKNAIVSPVAGLIVYDTTLNKLCVRAAAAWETITSV